MLIDPDKWNQEHLDCLDESPDFFFLGGSYVSQDLFTEICWALKAKFDTPIILFPADPSHLTEHADAVLMLSLVSGRNPEFLIGKHVVAAPYLKRSGLLVEYQSDIFHINPYLHNLISKKLIELDLI